MKYFYIFYIPIAIEKYIGLLVINLIVKATDAKIKGKQ